jgi:hypothetical protein
MDTPAEPPAVDPARCPLCGAPNGCALQAARASNGAPQPCWCTRVRFAPQLLARVPAPAQRRACICAACAASSG